MSIVKEVAKELVKMFFADASLTLGTLALIVLVAVLVSVLLVPPLWGGVLLGLGAAALVATAAVVEAYRRAA